MSFFNDCLKFIQINPNCSYLFILTSINIRFIKDLKYYSILKI